MEENKSLCFDSCEDLIKFVLIISTSFTII